MNVSESIKCKLIAIAKDEGRFLPEWIFHHLYFGFDYIDIYINRTTDNSEIILEKISKYKRNVRYYKADWVDIISFENNTFSSYIQNIIYAFSYYKEENDIDYIMFLDIDEYWFPKNSKDTIKDCLEKLSFPNTISFEWFCLNGNEHKNILFQNKLFGISSPFVKTIIKKGMALKSIGIHVPLLESYENCYLSDHSQLEISENEIFEGQAIRTTNTELKEYFIVHDWLRSKKYYLSSLLRGRALKKIDNTVFTLKDNRRGYNIIFDWDKKIYFTPCISDKYKKLYFLFLNRCKLEVEIKKAELFKLRKAIDCLNILIKDKNFIEQADIVKGMGNLFELKDQIINEINLIESNNS